MPRAKKVDAVAPAVNKINNNTKTTTRKAAQNNSSVNQAATSSELKQWYEDKARKSFESAENGLKKLRDPQKSTVYRNISNYNKETIKTYLKNISSNEKNLRNLSRYLFYRSHIYFRLVKYYASQADLSIRSVIPNYSLTEENNKDEITQSYYDTLKVLNEMNLQYEFFKVYVTALVEDVFYGCAYYTEGEGMFILPIDPDYAKITGFFLDGSYAFSVNMTYFRSKQDLLEFYGSPFTEMYSAYESTGEQWQLLDPQYSVCVKFRAENWETIVPVFASMFIDLISLLDLADIQAVVDEKQIYNLVWMEMETFNNSGVPNDFKVDPEQVTIPYWNKMTSEALPDYVSYALVPGKINKMSFADDQASDVNKIQKATENILNTSGGAQILNSATISGSTAFAGSMAADAEFALSSVIPQTQIIVNRLLSYYVSNPCKVRFFEVSIFTKDTFKKSILESAQYGLPTKLMLNNMNGFSELDTLALNFLEEDCLQLSTKFVPLQSSYVQSGNTGGGQTKDDDEISDAGEASRDKRDKAK